MEFDRDLISGRLQSHGADGRIASGDARATEIVAHRHGVDSAGGESPCQSQRASIVLVGDFAGCSFTWNVRANLGRISVLASLADATVANIIELTPEAVPYQLGIAILKLLETSLITPMNSDTGICS